MRRALDKNNRWVKLSECVPWDELSESYYQGLPGYQATAPFAPSLLVEIRKRMGEAVFEGFHRAIIDAHEGKKPVKPEPQAPAGAAQRSEPDADLSEEKPSDSSAATFEQTGPEATHRGQLILDATVVEQAIRFPTDLSLLYEAREFSEHIIDTLCANLKVDNKPRTYRRKARAAYLSIAKQKRPGRKTLRRGLKQQLQYLRRNLSHIEQLLAPIPEGQPLPLPGWLLHRYWVIQHLYPQQSEMHRTQTHRCDHRIVSISQPYVRPMVRGKQDKPVEFGAKLSVSLTGEGLAHVDHLRWDAFHEGLDLATQVEAYRERYGHYPERVIADPIYGTRASRDYLKQRGIHFAGKPLGRPKQVTDANREQRIPIEGKFGQGKNGYRLNDIRAKSANTSFAWINTIFLVMNLLILARIFFALRQCRLAGLIKAVARRWEPMLLTQPAHFNLAGRLVPAYG